MVQNLFVGFLFVVLACTNLQAQGFRKDRDTPSHNAVVRLGICTGTLISSTVILTASHCLPKDWLQPANGTPPIPCPNLPHQLSIAGSQTNTTQEWQKIFRKAGQKLPRVEISASVGSRVFSTSLTHYALPACADIALLQAFQRVPPTMALPLAVLSGPIEDGGNPFFQPGTGELTYAGWGRTKAFPEAKTHRQTAPMAYWGSNDCLVFTVPPRRTPDGPRIIQGDSGSPLIIEGPSERIVAGVLFGSGVPDIQVCGDPVPRLTNDPAAYTPTYRPALVGTAATDIGAWLRRLVPEANHKVSP